MEGTFSHRGGFLVSRIHFLSGRVFGRKLKDRRIELNPAQGRIMFALWLEDGLSFSELAGRTSLGKSTLTSMIDRLEKAGYLCRKTPPEDRRSMRIYTTEKDRERQALYREASEEMTAIFYRGFSGDEIDAFEGYLERILENLTGRR